MKIQDENVLFEHLSQPSSIVGEKDQIQAKTPSFVASNAKGAVRKVDNLHQVEKLGMSAAQHLKSLFE